MSHRAARIVGLAGLLVVVLSACGGQDEGRRSSSAQAPIPAAEDTSIAPEQDGNGGGADVIDACLLVTLEELGDVLDQTVMVSATEPGACTFAVGSPDDLTVRVDAYGDDGEGLEGVFSELEAGVSGTVEPVVIGDIEGLMFTGTTFDVPSTTGAVVLEGLIIVINFYGNGGDPVTNVEAVTQLLEFAIDGD